MNTEAVSNYLVDWLREKVEGAACKGVVLGISGGIDSAVAAALAKKAFPDNCMGVILPCNSNPQDVMDGRLLAEALNVPYHVIELDDAYQLLLTQFETFFKLEGSSGKLLKANIKPRLRMMSLYYFAQANDYMVLGTSNKSEITVGYATKYGDSGVDLQILGDLRKDQVYALASYLNIPQQIIARAPSAGLWEEQTDEGEMGFTYKELDEYIHSGQGDPQVIAKIQAMNSKSDHKRQLPPVAIIPSELGGK